MNADETTAFRETFVLRCCPLRFFHHMICNPEGNVLILGYLLLVCFSYKLSSSP